MTLTPDQIAMILGLVQMAGTQIGSLMTLARDGGATEEELQAAYDDAHAKAMAYKPVAREEIEPGEPLPPISG